jgi:multisubunit Na+/H+ antiporter MnhB subunit
MDSNPVFRLAAKILFAPIILFGLYVQFHGDFGPGGGFQAGVIIAAAFILHGLVFGLEKGRRLVSEQVNLWIMAIGVLMILRINEAFGSVEEDEIIAAKASQSLARPKRPTSEAAE